MNETTPVAGWYPDPSGDTTKLRYWDGTQWTDHSKAATTVGGTVPTTPATPTSHTPYQAAPGQPVYTAPTYSQPAYIQPQANGLAIGAMITGIAGLVGLLCFGILLPCSIAAIILGVIGRKKEYQKGMATAGLIMGITGVVLVVVIVCIFFLALGFSAAFIDDFYEGLQRIPG